MYSVVKVDNRQLEKVIKIDETNELVQIFKYQNPSESSVEIGSKHSNIKLVTSIGTV